MVPGHEIIGKVVEIGDNVTSVEIGDNVAVGNMLDSCRQCKSCQKANEQYCLNGGPTWTYNSKERVNVNERYLYPEGEATYGGYSANIICTEPFVFKLPPNMDLATSAPLLFAVITVYYPLKHYKIGKGHKVDRKST